MSAKSTLQAEALIDRQLAGDVIDMALSGGADFAEIFVEDRQTAGLSFLDGRIKNATSGQSRGAGVRVLHGTHAVYAHTNDLSRDGLMAVAKAVSQARAGSERHARAALSDVAPARELSGWQSPFAVSAERKISLFQQADRAARAVGSEISQVDLSLSEQLQHVQIVNSEGLWATDVRPYIRFNLSAIATGAGEFQTANESPGALMGYEFIEGLDVVELAQRIAKVAITMLKAGYAPSGKMPVVIDNGFGGVIFHEACGHLLETTSVATGASVLAGKLGQQIAHSAVTALDDGTLDGAWGSLAIDDEGAPTQKTVLIENGILKSYMVDKLGARKTGYAPTGSGRRESYRYAPTSRMRNTYIAPGSYSLDDLIASVPYGLYAKRMGGGSVSPGTGDFNFSVREAYMIRDGKIAEPVRGATLIGNGADALMKIDMVGHDLALAEGMCGSISGSIPVTVGQPPLRVSEIVVGGR